MVYLVLAIFLLFQTAYAQEPLRGSVQKTWTIEEARQEAFSGIETSINPKQFPKRDPNYQENMSAIRAGIEKVGGRVVSSLSYPNGEIFGYNVRFLENPSNSFQYDVSGKIMSIIAYSKGSDENDLWVGAKYVIDRKLARFGGLKSGELADVSISINKRTAFLFRPNGDLKGHRIGERSFSLGGKALVDERLSGH